MSKKNDHQNDFDQFHSKPMQLELFLKPIPGVVQKRTWRRLRNYLAGAARVLDISSSISSYPLNDEVPGFYLDRISQASDWIAVSKDLNYALAKFKESQGDGKAA